jgi:GAF domain-containing protein
MNSSNPIPEAVETALATGDPKTVLDATIQALGCQAGTVHWLDPQSGVLKLAAHRNIPPPIAEIVATVPIGKGIAGLAAQRREPVSLCNLQTDTSGQARPAAKTTGMEGSLAVPMLVGGELRGVLGIAKATAHDWTDEEKAVVLAIAAKLGGKR